MNRRTFCKAVLALAAAPLAAIAPADGVNHERLIANYYLCHEDVEGGTVWSIVDDNGRVQIEADLLLKASTLLDPNWIKEPIPPASGMKRMWIVLDPIPSTRQCRMRLEDVMA